MAFIINILGPFQKIIYYVLEIFTLRTCDITLALSIINVLFPFPSVDHSIRVV